MVCPSVRELIHSLKLVNYLVQVDKPWYKYFLIYCDNNYSEEVLSGNGLFALELLPKYSRISMA